MITIGTAYLGPELRDSKVHAALSKVMQAAIEARGDFEFGTAPAVNVVFTVPGSLGGPNWSGARDGTFSRKEKMLMIEIAVPEEIVSSDRVLDFIIEALRGANAIASDVYRKRCLPYPLRKAEELVTNIEQLAKHMS